MLGSRRAVLEPGETETYCLENKCGMNPFGPPNLLPLSLFSLTKITGNLPRAGDSLLLEQQDPFVFGY